MFNIAVTPDDVNKYVTQAIMESSIGINLKAAIDKELKDAIDGYDSPVKKVCREAIRAAIQGVIDQPSWKEKINEAVAKHVTDDFLNSVIRYAVDKTVQDLRDR